MPIEPEKGNSVTGNLGKYTIESIITEGDTAWSLKASLKGREVFLKYYKSPTPATSWYENYIRYQEELTRRLREADAGLYQYCVLANDIFCASPDPDDIFTYLFQAYDFIHAEDMAELLTRRLIWKKRRAIAKVFLMAMWKVHEAGVVHGDLKPANVQMLPTEAEMGLVPRIIDMDRSLIVGQMPPWRTGAPGEQEGYSGTPGYYSPEHLRGQCPQLASDVFTIGIILSELLCGMHPYGRVKGNAAAYKEAVLNGRYDEPKLLATLGGSAEYARSYAGLIQRCLDPEPANRPSCAELHHQLLELDLELEEEDDYEDGGDTFPRPEDVPPPLTVRRSAPIPVTGGSPSTHTIPLPPEKPSPHPILPPPGKNPPTALRLAGNYGFRDFRLSLEVGKEQLADVTSDARFAERRQFSVERTPENDWFISPFPDTKAATILNGSELTKRTRLREHDTLCLMGRESLKTAMQLSVSLIPLK